MGKGVAIQSGWFDDKPAKRSDRMEKKRQSNMFHIPLDEIIDLSAICDVSVLSLIFGIYPGSIAETAQYNARTPTRKTKEKILLSLQKELRRARNITGITQAELTTKVGLGSNKFSHYERNEINNISGVTLLRLLSIFPTLAPFLNVIPNMTPSQKEKAQLRLKTNYVEGKITDNSKRGIRQTLQQLCEPRNANENLPWQFSSMALDELYTPFPPLVDTIYFQSTENFTGTNIPSDAIVLVEPTHESSAMAMDVLNQHQGIVLSSVQFACKEISALFNKEGNELETYIALDHFLRIGAVLLVSIDLQKQIAILQKIAHEESVELIQPRSLTTLIIVTNEQNCENLRQINKYK